MDKIKEVKLVLLGDAGVGKSSIISRFVYNEFNTGQDPTLGASFFSKIVFPSTQGVKFQIWDTAGQEKFHSLAPMYYKECDVALCVYDITSKASFEVMKNWVKELRDKGPKKAIICMIGNKIDLIEQQQVTNQEAKTFAENEKIMFKLTSAKENSGIEDFFHKIAEELTKDMVKNPSPPPNQGKIDLTKPNQNNGMGKNSKGCC